MKTLLLLSSLFLFASVSFAQPPKTNLPLSPSPPTPSIMQNSGQEGNRKITDSSFSILQNPQPFYEGEFRNDKPYAGYFKIGDEDIFWVDYYENGARLRQYSFDLLPALIAEEKEAVPYDALRQLDRVATFKEGLPVEGPVMAQMDQGLWTGHYATGQLQQVTLEVFAMHYYNRINALRQGDEVILRSMRDEKPKLLVRFTPMPMVSLMIPEEVLTLQFFEGNLPSLTPHRHFRIQHVNGRTAVLTVQEDLDEAGAHEGVQLFKIISEFLWQRSCQGPEDFLSHLNQLELQRSDDEGDIWGIGTTDGDGNIIKGILYHPGPPEGFTSYKNGELDREEKGDLNAFYKRLEKEGY